MKGLIVKDMCLLLQQKKTILAIIVLSFFLNINSDGSFVICYLPFVCSFLALGSISYDEYDNGYSFLFTLPIERKTYIKEKYLFSMLVAVVSWLAGCLIAIAFYLSKGEMASLKLGMTTAVVIFPVMLFFYSITLPLQFYYGTEKSRIAMFGVYGVLLLAGYLAVRIGEHLGVNILQILEQFFEKDTLLAGVAFFAATLVTFFLSCLISISILHKKEF